MITKIFLEARMFSSPTEFKSFLADKGIHIEGGVDYYMDSGANGDVYKVKGKPRVIKVEGDWTRKTYDIYEKIRQEDDLNHVVKVFYNKLVGNKLITVLEYLEPVGDIILPETSWFVLLHMEDVYYSETYRAINEFSVYRTLIERMTDHFPEGMIKEAKEIMEEIMDEYKVGDDKLMRILVKILLEVWVFPHDHKYIQCLKDVRDNPELFKSVYDGILEFESMGIKHGDIHLDNILKDPKTGYIKLIDPYPR